MLEITVPLEYKDNSYDVDVLVTDFYHQPPSSSSAHFCDSDYDYYGYTELEFDVIKVVRYDEDFEVIVKDIPDELEDELYEEVENLTLEYYNGNQ